MKFHLEVLMLTDKCFTSALNLSSLSRISKYNNLLFLTEIKRRKESNFLEAEIKFPTNK